MSFARILAAALLLPLAACNRTAGNDSSNAANIAAEEGVTLETAIGGDELSPVAEADDDMVANQAGANAVGRPAPPPANSGMARR